MGGGRRLGNGGRPLVARHRQVLRPPNRATAGNDRIFERHRERVQYPCQPNKKTARRRSQSLARERYWFALKIWSAWANRNQSQNPVTATKAPEKTRLERRFCVILQPQSFLIATSVPTGMIVWPRQQLFGSHGAHPSRNLSTGRPKQRATGHFPFAFSPASMAAWKGSEDVVFFGLSSAGSGF